MSKFTPLPLTERRAAWLTLHEEAKQSNTCIVCGFPLVQPKMDRPGGRGGWLSVGAPRIRCPRAECKKGYMAMYGRLWRRG